ncbi:MAG: hypothetical protein E6Q34_06560 [Burkholderiaceae bacterium]|jgi:hypothetical protein|nr:MAG: hypothetical protein E6Q34_06560 [Burkholderiaceae bacterium]
MTNPTLKKLGKLALQAIGILVVLGFLALMVLQAKSNTPPKEIELTGSDEQQEATTTASVTEECPLTWQATYYASTSAPILFPLPKDSNQYTDIEFSFDDHTGAKLNHGYWRDDPCSARGVLYEFYTNADSGKVTVTNNKTGQKATVIVTNPLDTSIPYDMDAAAFALVKPYVLNFKSIGTFGVFMREDINGDARKDYALYLENTLLTKTQRDIERNRTLVIITSTQNGGYEISGFAPSVLDCGECGGASFPSGPAVTANFENGELEISEEGGTSFRRYDRITLIRKDGCWRAIKRWSASQWLNGETEEERDWQESEQDLDGKCIGSTES